jgi:hypothetical protein
VDHFTYVNGVQRCKEVPDPDLAGRFGTPL